MKKVKCRACGKRKDQDQFDWLKTKLKHHINCKSCVKKICTDTNRKWVI